MIFTTAYDEYALKAFEVNALDYLLKPVEPKRLADAIQKISQQPVQPREHNIASENFNQSLLNEHDQVFVKDGERCWFVKLTDIRLLKVLVISKVFFGTHNPLF